MLVGVPGGEVVGHQVGHVEDAQAADEEDHLEQLLVGEAARAAVVEDLVGHLVEAVAVLPGQHSSQQEVFGSSRTEEKKDGLDLPCFVSFVEVFLQQ